MKMKKAMGLILVIISVISLFGCQNDTEAPPKNELYEGYITSVEDNKLLLNDFKFVYTTDKELIESLELTAEDMPNGYYIHDTSDELLNFTLNDDTQYMFYDTSAMFVPEDSEDRLYATNSQEEFLLRFGENGPTPLESTPFEVKVSEDGKVISISEIFVN